MVTTSGLPLTWISASTGVGPIARATPRTIAARKPKLGELEVRTGLMAELVNLNLPAGARLSDFARQ
jgi:hypothetical protein